MGARISRKSQEAKIASLRTKKPTHPPYQPRFLKYVRRLINCLQNFIGKLTFFAITTRLIISIIQEYAMSDMYFTSMYDRLKTGRRRSKNEGEIVSAFDAAIRASLQDVGGKTSLQSGDSVSEASSSTTTVGLSALENASIKKKRPTPEKSTSQQIQDKKRKRSRKLSGRQSGAGVQHRKRKSQTPRDGSLDPTVKLKRSNKRVSQTTLPGTEIQPEDLGAIQDQVKEVEIVRDENGDEVKIF